MGWCQTRAIPVLTPTFQLIPWVLEKHDVFATRANSCQPRISPVPTRHFYILTCTCSRTVTSDRQPARWLKSGRVELYGPKPEVELEGLQSRRRTGPESEGGRVCFQLMANFGYMYLAFNRSYPCTILYICVHFICWSLGRYLTDFTSKYRWCWVRFQCRPWNFSEGTGSTQVSGVRLG